MKTFCKALLKSLLCVCLIAPVSGCSEAPKETSQKAPTAAHLDQPPAAESAPEAVATLLNGQRADGRPYEIIGSEVWDVPDPVSGRVYQVFVTLPRSYTDHPERRYPVLYVTDADYAFPMIRLIAGRLNGNGPDIEDFILVGLSYAIGEEGMPSRRRDYTPTAAGARGTPAGTLHGQADAYIDYLRDQVMPFIAGRYRIDESRRYYLGHSYGGLLGTQVLLSDPTLFAGYILGSPSYWYDNHHMDSVESSYAAAHRDLPAKVYMYVGEYEDMRPGDPRYAKRYNMVTDARRMTQSLQSRGYPSLRLKLDVLREEDHLSVAPSGFTRGLKFLLGTDRS